MRGGKRAGAGRSFSWIHGKTKVIRVPESLAERVLEVTRLLDEGRTVEDVTKSKYIDLSGAPLYQIEGQPAIVLKDLLNLGFKIRPLKLVDRVRRAIDKIG